MEEKSEILRDSRGRFLPGQHVSPNPTGRPKNKRDSLRNLISAAFDESIDIYYGGKLEEVERKKIMATHIANMIVFGQIRLPSDNAEEEGRLLKFRADDYMKHLIRTLRFLEPIENETASTQGIEAIIWDLPIGKEVIATKRTLQAQEQSLQILPPSLEELEEKEEKSYLRKAEGERGEEQ